MNESSPCYVTRCLRSAKRSLTFFLLSPSASPGTPESSTLNKSKSRQQEERSDEERQGKCDEGEKSPKSQGEKSWGGEEGRGGKSGCCITLSSSNSSRTWPGSPRYHRNAHFLMEQIRRRWNGEAPRWMHIEAQLFQLPQNCSESPG